MFTTRIRVTTRGRSAASTRAGMPCVTGPARVRHCGMFLLVFVLLAGNAARAESGLNVLLICSDDMRPQLGCYGDPVARTPNLDRLAARGTVFTRSYVQQALCSPSRISMLSGRYPATTGIFEIGRPLRATMPDITTVPQHFKNHGYDCRSFGKVYHVGIDDEASWSVPAWHSQRPRYGREGQAAVAARRQQYRQENREPPRRGKGAVFYAGPAFEATDLTDDELLDGDTAARAIEQLREYGRNRQQPFFLAVGFSNPHVPWVSPRRYWELYDRASLPLATNTFLPRDAPPFAATSGQDFLWYGNVPEGPLDEPFQRACLHGYLAAISYVDALVGRVLDALDETGLASRTVVVFWTDHGYYMGEHTWWGAKHNNYEGATRNAMIVALPPAADGPEAASPANVSPAKGSRTCAALVQAVDLGPTLVDVCGLPPVEGFEGRSLKPLLEDPEAVVNEAAFSWYPKGRYLGVAMRTERWRLVEWTLRDGAAADSSPIYELYDQERDPQNDVNLAARPEHARLIADLRKLLHQRFPSPDAGSTPPR